VQIAAATPDALHGEAIDTVHQRSGGIPRTISVICDNALVTGFALDKRPSINRSCSSLR